MMRMRQKPVVLHNMESMNLFLNLMQTRIDPDKERTVPFTAFQLSIYHLNNEILERFGVEIGPNVRRLGLGRLCNPWCRCRHLFELERVVTILRRTVNIVEIDLMSCSFFRIPDSGRESLPDSYPGLVVIRSNYKDSGLEISKDPPEKILMNILISKAPNLHLGYVHALGIPDIPTTENPALPIPRNLTLNQTTPIANLGIEVRPHSCPLLQELQKMNLHIQHLYPHIYILNATRTQIRNLLCYFSDWLANLSPNLYTLDLNFTLCVYRFETPGNFDLVIPPLEKLNDWIFKAFVCLGPSEEDGEPSITISVPLTRDQFPNLKNFTFIGFRNTILTFPDHPQPSVQEFRIYSPGILESSPWHGIFPNLTTIVFFFQAWMPEFERNLIYVLNHFPRITHLELNLRHGGEKPVDCWDILTGGAPRGAGQSMYQALFQDVMPVDPIKSLNESVDGVCQVPSLGNLRGDELSYT